MRHSRLVVPTLSLVVLSSALTACDDGGRATTATEPMSPDAPALAKAAAARDAGVVYALTNDSTSNAVLVYRRSAAGALSLVESVVTGGRGTGAGLGSQGALTISGDGKWLLAVNAGSDEISLFSLRKDHPTLVSTVSSGGDLPISVTESHGVVYALNAGQANDIVGFTIVPGRGRNASLVPIEGAVRGLSSGNAGGAQVQFTPSSDALIVTEKNTNKILSFPVGLRGVAGAPTTTASAGTTPFGFAFAGDSLLVVSEAFASATNGSAASSYRVGRDGVLSVVSASIGTQQTAACWFVTTRDGRFAYTTNAGSASVSGFRIGTGGQLQLASTAVPTASTGASPNDEAMSADGAFLYTLDAGAHTISAFAVRTDGTLLAAGRTERLPVGAAGLVAR